MNPELIGFAAGIFIAFSLLPQIIRSWRTKSTHDISIGWNLMNMAGQVLWALYGVVMNSASLVVMSGITLVMSSSVLYLKLRYGMGKTKR